MKNVNPNRYAKPLEKGKLRSLINLEKTNPTAVRDTFKQFVKLIDYIFEQNRTFINEKVNNIYH